MAAKAVAARAFLKDGRLRPTIRVLIFAAATVFAAASLGIVAGVLARPLVHGPSLNSFGLRAGVGELDLAIAVVSVALFLRRYLDHRPNASLGFSFRAPWLRLTAIGFIIGAGMQLLIFGADRVLRFSQITVTAPLTLDLTWLPIYVVFFVLAALAEEMSIHGYIFQNLWEDWGFVPALVLTSAVFAGVHLGNPNARFHLVMTIAGLAAYGIWASLTLLWTKSLWLALGCHFAWNVFEGAVLGFPVSGVSFGHPAIAQVVRGPAWFTGGAFGPEAGASSALALLIGLGAVYALYRRGAFASVPDTREPYAMRPRV